MIQRRIGSRAKTGEAAVRFRFLGRARCGGNVDCTLRLLREVTGGRTPRHAGRRHPRRRRRAMQGWGVGRVVLNLNRHEGHEEIELVNALDLETLFGVTGPDRVPVLGLPWHVAHKIHAVSRPSTRDHPNDRVQDVADLLLLQPLITDLPAVRRACERVFRDRGTHSWPPTIALPPTWAEPYARLANEFELPAPTLDAAARAITAWVSAMVSAR